MVKRKITISIVVPVFNEIGNIQQFHETLLKTMARSRAAYEIIYIDDNSTDGTHEWLTSVSIEPTVKVHQKNGVKGKSFSLMQGFDTAEGKILVMIDGDLQYPPEKIPEMIAELKNADVVVANRTDYQDVTLRRLLSKGFRNIFGGWLFGLKTDIQSGMKVFTREVYKTVRKQPHSPWTFDLEFLHRARQAGYTITDVPITFSSRKNGESKISALSQSWEIGMNALYIKLQRTFYLSIQPEEKTMRGAGIGHKKRKYITHTTLPVGLSAIRTFSLTQKLFYIGIPLLLVISLFLFTLPTARLIVAILSVLYFADALFNVFVVLKSLQNDQEMKFTESELMAIDEKKLPVYTILCPLYKEAHVVPQFLEGIAKIDWPKEKLDVMFLLEEDDTETIHAFSQMTLPYYARTVIVPDSQPKTKPKACNYGLTFAKGKYLVVFDAEDMPDPLQLKKAYLGFQKADKNVKCLQAKLSYYNSRQNLLTRFFTAEYALWFDITLPGLQSLNSALPLGGTSNHFETANLLELEGWDPFNVTEDADLGVRLFQKGYRTAIIDSTTYEEATSVTKNWLRQRSRWLKGYMQTYLVHTRNMIPFIKSKGVWHYSIFQMTVGGKILFVLLNPLMWVITFLYFAAYPVFGPPLQQMYQPPYSYLAVISWIFGNFMFFYCYLIAVAKREQWDIAKYVLAIPVYWLMMSTAAAIGLYQLILKPHYWEKTIHGFHLGKRAETAPAAVAPTPMPAPAIQPVYMPSSAEYTTEKPQIISISLLPVSQDEITKFIMRWLPLFAILNVDLVLARVFLSIEDAQTYIILSLFGKALFLIGQFVSNVMTSFFTKNKLNKAYLYRQIFSTFLFNWMIFAVFGLEGSYTLQGLSGTHFAAIIPYTSFYLFGLFCISIAYRLTIFNLSKKIYSYMILLLGALLLQAPLVYFNHDSVGEMVRTFSYVGSLTLLLSAILEMSANYKRIVENNLTSLLSLFERDSKKEEWSRNYMRILVFNWRDTKHKFTGGAEVYVQELAKRWVESGNSVTVFCGNDNKHSKYEEIDGVEIYRRGGTYTVYFFAFIYYLLKFRGKYDLIVDCENGIPFFTPLYAKEQSILLIHHVHQEIFHKFLSFPLNLIAALLEGKLMPLAYRNKNVVTVSASSKKDIMNLGFTNEQSIQIIPNGVSSKLFVDYPKTDYPSYIYLGRLKDYKNIDVAIKAFAKVVRIEKKAKLEIVGEGESYLTLVKLVEELGIKNSVSFHGRVSEEEKVMLLAKSWAALQPSQMEGWGLTVIEANATGTPVIASRVNGLQDSVLDGHTGILVQPGSVTQFANAMMKIVEDDSLRMNLSQEAKNWAKNFDWSKSAEVFLSLIGKNFGQEIFHTSYSDLIVSAIDKGMNNLQ